MSNIRDEITKNLPPEKIYRYLSFDRAKQAIERSQLWFSSPDKFNDPFDMYLGLIDFRINNEYLKSLINKHFSNLNKDQRRKKLKYYSSHKSEYEAKLKEKFSLLRQDSGVCCFSEINNSILLWSHYAAAHSGICLGFIFPYITLTEKIEPIWSCKINYIDKVVSTKYIDEQIAFFNWIHTKTKVWEYEKEVRQFSHKKNGLIDFDKYWLKEIYFGNRVSEKEIADIIELTEKLGYKIEKFSQWEINEATFDLSEVIIET